MACCLRHGVLCSVIVTFSDWERRAFLALPKRESDTNYHRLDTGEIAPLVAALTERERELRAMAAFDAPVFRNVEALGARLRLAPVERALLAFAVIVESLRSLRDAMERLAQHMRDRPALVRGLAALLDCDASAVLAALHPEGALARTGLVRIDLQSEEGMLLRARDGIATVLLDEFDACDALFARFTAPARVPLLSAEDFSPADDSSTGKVLGKAAFNHLLETNPVPMVWISNEIKQIDPAYLRRFACVLEVRKPNRTVRRRIAEHAFRGLGMRDAWLDRMSDLEEASPGQVAQAARVARLLSAQAPVRLEAMAERVLGHGMRALGQRRSAPCADAARFDLSLLNCGADMHALVRNIARQPSAHLAFYGPPGTGKSALARHLAQAAARPLLVKRASDLLSPWVGECEQNIARAFEQATDEGALLLLDEADSFLCDRRDARARWELTETNELLAQMEQFTGMFVCTTNLMHRLDRAALRRFSLKLRFDYLEPQQVCRMLVATLKTLGAEPACEVQLAQAERLICATPGDFAAVAQRFRLLGETPPAAQFICELRDELAFKQEGGVQRMGF